MAVSGSGYYYPIVSGDTTTCAWIPPPPPKPQPDFQTLFLLELLTRSEEMGMIEALCKDPNDVVTRAQYVDYLLDHNRTTSAEQVRIGLTPSLGGYRAKSLSTFTENK